MKALLHKSRYFESTGSNVMIRLIVASAISVLSLSPAFADRDDGYGGGYRDGDRGHQEWHGNEGGYRGGDHDHQEWHGNGGGYRDGDRGHQEWHGYGYGGYPQPYGYAQPVRVPPPVYYSPQQSPGITLVLPLNFGR